MTRRALASLALAALALAGGPACGKKAVVTVVAPTPPAVVSVQPPARTLSYLYDGGIWAVFDRALDPKTVDTTTVFLKQDTQRIPIAVRWDAGSKRVVIAPRSPLGLQKAYTVVLSTRLHATDGTPLPAEYTWQFVTNTVRRARYDFPLPDTLRSRVVMLQWSSPDVAAGGVVQYELYAGTDSAAVAGRTLPYLYRGTGTTYVPRTEWPAGTRVYWAISAVQTSSGERIASPATHFDTTPVDAPTQSVTIPVVDWGGLRSGSRVQLCSFPDLTVGPLYAAGMHFPTGGYPIGARVKSVRLDMRRAASTVPATTIWMAPATSVWTNCSANYPGPPFGDPSFTTGATSENGADLVFESVGLAAWIEASRRIPINNGFSFGCTGGDIVVNIVGFEIPRPTMTVTYYVP